MLPASLQASPAHTVWHPSPPTQAPKHGWQATEAAVQSSFGAPISELFEAFEAEPVASGSIAQVGAAANGVESWVLPPGHTLASQR